MANVVGLLAIFLAVSMFATAVVALLYDANDWRGFVWSGFVTLLLGGLVFVTTRVGGEVTLRESFATVTAAWSVTAVLGALPYLFTGAVDSPIAALFESMSGFTTTGATVFADVEALTHGLLFWRALTHWLGGMGIIVLVVAILPHLSVGGMQLFRAEVPGPTPGRLRPRIAQTAKLLWQFYLGLTVLAAALYLTGGLTMFEAITHSFSVVSTGGFGTRNDSMASFGPFVQWVTILLMYVSGVNFALHFRAASGRFTYLQDAEWRFYTFVMLSVTALIFTLGALGGLGDEATLREELFAVVATTTTTGFVAADYETWVPGAQMLLLALYFVGGMAGSTGGGIKTLRVMLLLKLAAKEIRKHLHPRAIILTRLGSRTVKEDVAGRILGFVVLYLLLCLAGAMAVAMTGVDPLSAIGASIASVGNVGPAFAALGPTDNFGWMSSPGLGVLTLLMLLGRLEIYTVLVLFHPDLWRSTRRISPRRAGFIADPRRGGR